MTKNANAIDLLKADHKKVKDLLKQLTETTARATKTRAGLLEKIETELAVHITLEEEIFYPALREAAGKKYATMCFEALEEHRAVEKMILPDLKRTRPDTDQFSGRAKVLKELVEHHVDEEEEEMFVVAKKHMSAAELGELADRMEARRDKLTS